MPKVSPKNVDFFTKCALRSNSTVDDIDYSKGKNANHSRKRRGKKLEKNKNMKKIKLEPESVDDPKPDVNSSADFEETKSGNQLVGK